MVTSLRPVTYEDVRWEPQGVRYASTALPKYGTYHPAVPASIAKLTLNLPPAVIAEAEAAEMAAESDASDVDSGSVTATDAAAD